MNDLNWLDFLDRIASEKGLTPKQKITLKTKYPVFNARIADNKFLIEKFGLKDENGVKKRLGILFKAFDVLDETQIDKAIELQGYLNKRYKEEQEALARSTEAPTKDELWSRLKDLGKDAPSRMGVSVKPQSDLSNMGGAFQKEDLPKQFLDTVSKGTERLKFQILSEGRGKVLLLLNRDTAGDIYCVCPSILTPSIEFDLEGEMIVPQEEFIYLPPPTRAGKEDWWAWIINEEPSSLSWWDKMRNNGGDTLTSQNLKDLLQCIAKNQNGEVLRTYYFVVENNRQNFDNDLRSNVK